MIIVYTGNGKGKTTAALGLALRAGGWNKKVLIVQFLKKQRTGEVKAIEQLDNLTIKQFGTKDLVDLKELRPIDFKEAQKGLEKARLEVKSGKWELIILDEVNVAVKFGLIKAAEVLRLIQTKPTSLDIVLTGRWANKKIIEAADLVTEFKEVKHPYIKGEKAKRGIDY
jgi:cob(I)alamin adenosyltransferase